MGITRTDVYNLKKSLEKFFYDLIIISSPDHTHYKILDKVLDYKPKLILETGVAIGYSTSYFLRILFFKEKFLMTYDKNHKFSGK